MKQKHSKKKHKDNQVLWLTLILVLAVTLSLTFSILSELVLSDTVVAVAIIVILIFILISVLFDMLGLAVASSNIEHFTAMAAKKIKGAKQAMIMCKGADKVSSICDVIGDVCGILSGAAGASILAKIAINPEHTFLMIFIPSLVSAIIAGLTIFGKAALKKVALKYANPITFKFAKFINFFTRKG